MRFLVLLAMAVASLNAAAQLYSWKDADGKVQYSDQPPPASAKGTVRKVAPPATNVADPDAVRKNLADKELEARKKEKEAKESATKAEKDKADAAERRINCEKAQGNLRGLESGQTRFTTDAQGNRVALEGAVLEAELAAARKNVDGLCK